VKRIFYDTEFIDDGKTIELISIGMTDDHIGDEYYAVNAGVDVDRIRTNKFLLENVIPTLIPVIDDSGRRLQTSHELVRPLDQIRDEVEEFILRGLPTESVWQDVELWAYYAAYDHVALAQLFGPMTMMPKRIPFYTNYLMQECRRLQYDPARLPKPFLEHHALVDARWNHRLWRALQRHELRSHEPRSREGDPA
jgi:DNA polymerase III epsilon subunit-like protein